jgi:hypothetical protein
MKTAGFRGMALVAAGVLAGVVHAETVSVVQLTDMRGQSEYLVMNREEYAALQKEIAEEAKVFAAAAAEAKKEWEADKENKLPFQGNRIKPRSAKKVGADFSDREKADKRKAQLEERFQEKQLEEQEKEEKALKNKKVSDEDTAKAAARTKAFDDAFAAISKKMGDKLGRPVPQIGLAFGEPAKKPEEKK